MYETWSFPLKVKLKALKGDTEEKRVSNKDGRAQMRKPNT